MGIIKFNNVDSSSIGLVVENPPDYEMPERIYDVTPVPGRNGDIVDDTEAYKNVTREYDVAIGAEGADFASLAQKVSKWLHSGHGYLRLEDSYTSDYFMMATFIGDSKITNILQQAGRITLEFDRKPQRFLKTGETPVTISTTNTTITNPTIFKSKPLLKVNGTGAGTVTIGSTTISILRNSGSIMIDSDTEDAYRESTFVNLNGDINTPSGFPIMVSGSNVIKFTGAITSVILTPRWWTI